MTKTNTPKKTKLLTYLEKGKTITEDQAYKKFGLRNLRATVSDLRKEGYVITPTTPTTNAGVTKYTLR